MAKDVPPSRTAPQFVVRLPDEEFRERIAEAAKANNRSMNAEIVDRLSRTFSGDDTAKLARTNTVLLRTLADFVLLRHRHPEVMAAMEDPVLRMASAVKETQDDAEIMKNARPGFLGYIEGLTDALNRANALMGSGWAGRKGAEKPTNET